MAELHVWQLGLEIGRQNSRGSTNSRFHDFWPSQKGWCPRCTALPTNLDGEGKRRSEEHTEVLVNCLDLGVLWDEYGIVGDLVTILTKGLRRFPQGRGFKQWTADNSKALMKPLKDMSPPDIVRTFRAFLEFYYLVRRDVHDKDTLAKIQDTLSKFHQYRTIFQNLGVRPTGFSLPHVPGHHQLMTNADTDSNAVNNNHNEDDAVPGHTTTSHVELGRQQCHQINQPDLPNLIQQFLFDQIHLDDVNASSSHDIPFSLCPYFDGQVSVFHSATAYYYAPCDPSGINCMRGKILRAVPSWRGGAP
ncbi:hypothetical protein SERLADRAFT_405629 [Serpula lacrymans var. lacrymans S7.9]|uniref:Uncharacterized protein n=1 Tax=Serpula lacrymans var. lacrymans (strain S7.9) TaxID=578457 RepID=F8NI24_SERL9|nr:uncharacterized protein SERLADRAFT_405629 [Serpula lacrymans var. lacrymans S7.9]EGO29746.1 hypothetical protein SERLADRAFT_405629 [Serpula lacrymans var. lacrymans S7.9]